MENETQKNTTVNENKQNSKKLDKCFFGQKNALKIQYNPENKAIYLGIGKKDENNTWTWKTAKLKDTEAAEIILVIQNKTDNANFYHTYKDETTKIFINRKDNTAFFKIENNTKALNPGEQEVLRIILVEIIREMSQRHGIGGHVD